MPPIWVEHSEARRLTSTGFRPVPARTKSASGGDRDFGEQTAKLNNGGGMFPKGPGEITADQ
jgi:hypothetical protein